MPNHDRSGPRGDGPLTGWARGLCRRKADTDAASRRTPDDIGWGRLGWGIGRGRGRGRGFGQGAGSGRGFGRGRGRGAGWG
ncbi:MAG: DUF5320 family protein [Dactylosporangium sp.]|nr:DUF5320 family protein [Dactylosporangium sp.]NNJ62031.1 DUF5320 family protein [Dactylosporangium sp.]